MYGLSATATTRPALAEPQLIGVPDHNANSSSVSHYAANNSSAGVFRQTRRRLSIEIRSRVQRFHATSCQRRTTRQVVAIAHNSLWKSARRAWSSGRVLSREQLHALIKTFLDTGLMLYFDLTASIQLPTGMIQQFWVLLQDCRRVAVRKTAFVACPCI